MAMQMSEMGKLARPHTKPLAELPPNPVGLEGYLPLAFYRIRSFILRTYHRTYVLVKKLYRKFNILTQSMSRIWASKGCAQRTLVLCSLMREIYLTLTPAR